MYVSINHYITNYFYIHFLASHILYHFVLRPAQHTLNCTHINKSGSRLSVYRIDIIGSCRSCECGSLYLLQVSVNRANFVRRPTTVLQYIGAIREYYEWVVQWLQAPSGSRQCYPIQLSSAADGQRYQELSYLLIGNRLSFPFLRSVQTGFVFVR